MKPYFDGQPVFDIARMETRAGLAHTPPTGSLRGSTGRSRADRPGLAGDRSSIDNDVHKSNHRSAITVAFYALERARRAWADFDKFSNSFGPFCTT